MTDPVILALNWYIVPFIFKHMGLNMWRFWFQGENTLAVLINTILIVPILACALFGMYLCLSGHVDYRVGVMLCLIITIYAVHIPIGAHARHHLALMPFLLLFGAIGVARMVLKAEHLIHHPDTPDHGHSMTPVS